MKSDRRRLELRKNNAYSTVLLVAGDTVMGAWDFESASVRHDWADPGDLSDWSGTCPDIVDPESYGELIDMKDTGGDDPSENLGRLDHEEH